MFPCLFCVFPVLFGCQERSGKGEWGWRSGGCHISRWVSSDRFGDEIRDITSRDVVFGGSQEESAKLGLRQTFSSCLLTSCA